MFDDTFQNRKPKNIFEKLFFSASDNILLNYYYQPNKNQKILKDNYQSYVDSANVDYCNDIKFIETPASQFSPFNRFKLLFTENRFGKIINSTISVVLNPTGLIHQRCAEDFSWASTKLLLAIKLYQIDNGKIITSLNELAPNYISEIPNDPFDGQPIRFLLEKGIIYSVGKDLRDDGGNKNNDLVIKIGFQEIK